MKCEAKLSYNNLGIDVYVIDRLGNSQYPTLYDNGTVAYDFPERITKGAKAQAAYLLRELKRIGVYHRKVVP